MVGELRLSWNKKERRRGNCCLNRAEDVIYSVLLCFSGEAESW